MDAKIDSKLLVRVRLHSGVAAVLLNQRFSPMAIMAGAHLALCELEDAFKKSKAKCPFVP